MLLDATDGKGVVDSGDVLLGRKTVATLLFKHDLLWRLDPFVSCRPGAIVVLVVVIALHLRLPIGVVIGRLESGVLGWCLVAAKVATAVVRGPHSVAFGTLALVQSSNRRSPCRFRPCNR